MKRFVSLDFLRGIAILLMLILHVILRFLDEDGLLAQMDNIPLINFVALFVLPFLGGLAGFFLLVSAIGNQVSMQRYIEKRQSPQGLILRQMVGGVILLFFAMLTEGLIGYHGAVGQSLQYMGSPTNTIENFWIIASSRYNHFETIHTIAWCVILNGLVQGLLARKGRWQDPKFMIKSYIILIIIVLVLTQPVWDLLNDTLGGYPWTSVTYGTYKTSIAEPSIIYENFWVVLSATFLAPLAAPLEPILPYLAVSFIGSIIGIYITLPADKRPKDFIKKTLKIGLILFAIGLIGIIVNMMNILFNVSLGEAASAYTNVTNHRAWQTDNPRNFADFMIPLSWFWQFIGLTGFAIMITMIVFRMVEFRGKAENFAKKTTFIRRFGIVAFTNYNNQFIFYLVGNLIIWILNNFTLPEPYGNQKLDWGFTGLIILLTLLIYHGINRAWEKVGYIGSIEWCLGTIGHYLLPRSKPTPTSQAVSTGERRLKLYEHGKIDVQGTFYNVEWINLVEANEEYHKAQRDSQVLGRVVKWSMIPLFIPASLLLFPAARKTRQIEGKNKMSNRAYNLSLFGTILTLTGIVLLSILTLNMIA